MASLSRFSWYFFFRSSRAISGVQKSPREVRSRQRSVNGCRESIGHGGVSCFACHGSPHAITPATTETDNLQAVLHQGFAGIISDCTVCHTQQPDEPFFHKVDD